MAKKSGVNIPAIQVIRLIVFLFIGFVCFIAYSRTMDFLLTSPVFAVRDVVIDASIQFIDLSDLRRLKGRNIFKTDIRRLQERIRSQYPQIAQLRVVRELPDRIKISAKKREVLFQMGGKKGGILVDSEGVAMPFVPGIAEVPVVQGALEPKSRVVLGAALKSKPVMVAIDILQGLKRRPNSGRLKVLSVDVANLSKIDVAVAGLHVILDEDNYAARLDMLEMLLAQKKINFSQVKYIDLRFNEPVLGENIEEQQPGQ